MRIGRFKKSGTSVVQFGVFASDAVSAAEAYSIESVPDALTGKQIALSEVDVLASVTPSKIVCVGRNYREHAAEMGNKMPDEPLLFLKAPSAVIGNGDCIQLPPESAQVEHEGELGVVIAREAHRLAEGDD